MIDGISHDPKHAAGKWGDYWCDLPVATFENLLEYVANDLKPDIVMWGGDSPSHDASVQSINETVSELLSVTSKVQSYLEGIPIFASLGNHDAFP